ncbi:MAG: hypothetical protein HOP14_05990 [Acidobacteria bacterium]|nr:hypothetical protein [Acidobacteriota bacterium]
MRGSSKWDARPVMVLAGAIALVATLTLDLGAQQAPQGGAARAVAPVDLTGYWVSVITEDWPYRMMTPAKGDAASVPLNPEGQRITGQWDPDRDERSNEQCRAYGAAGIMRLPVRLHITWENDTTLKMEIDAGQQVRLFHFGQAAAPRQASWQGHSVASWETVADGQGLAPAAGRGGGPQQQLSGSLKVTTSRMRPGYLRRNGVPYSGNASMLEYFDRITEPNGDVWLILTSTLEDPTYLNIPYMLSTHFKKEPDGSKWNPRPCEVVRPTV